jgi:hypothetical protein
MMTVPVIDELIVLKAAREDYEKNGFATGTFEDSSGYRCAVSCLRFAAQGLDIPRGDHIIRHAFWLLNNEAKKIYGISVIGVNDTLGRPAVLQCYDGAMKEFEKECAE